MPVRVTGRIDQRRTAITPASMVGTVARRLERTASPSHALETGSGVVLLSAPAMARAPYDRLTQHEPRETRSLAIADHGGRDHESDEREPLERPAEDSAARSGSRAIGSSSRATTRALGRDPPPPPG